MHGSAPPRAGAEIFADQAHIPDRVANGPDFALLICVDRADRHAFYTVTVTGDEYETFGFKLKTIARSAENRQQFSADKSETALTVG